MQIMPSGLKDNDCADSKEEIVLSSVLLSWSWYSNEEVKVRRGVEVRTKDVGWTERRSWVLPPILNTYAKEKQEERRVVVLIVLAWVAALKWSNRFALVMKIQ